MLSGIINRIKQLNEGIQSGEGVRNRNRREILEQKSKREGRYADNWFVRKDKDTADDDTIHK